MKDWTEITISVLTGDVDTVAAIAQMCVSGGVSIEDYSQFEEDISLFGPVEIIDEDLLRKAADKEHAKVRLYISPDENPAEAVAFMQERLGAENISYTIDTSDVREEDWANNWKQYFKPLPVGENLLIVPTWDDAVPPEYSGRTRLMIDPGMAFGSGQHETTKLCLEMIERFLQKGQTVLDIGTGSGILAIGALLLGADNAVGVDIDKLAVRVAAENAALNNVGERYTAVCGDLAEKVHGRFDIICANIVADVIIRLLDDVGDLLNEGGVIIMSGIIDERENDVLSKLDSLGYEVCCSEHDRGWCCICAK